MISLIDVSFRGGTCLGSALKVRPLFWLAVNKPQAGGLTCLFLENLKAGLSWNFKVFISYQLGLEASSGLPRLDQIGLIPPLRSFSCRYDLDYLAAIDMSVHLVHPNYTKRILG